MKTYKYYNILLTLLILLIFAAVIVDAINGKKIESLTERLIDKSVECSELQIDVSNKLKENEKLLQELNSLGDDIASLHAELEVVATELQEYKNRAAKYFSNNYEIQDFELEMLYKIVESECTAGDTSSKINATHVIFNRVMHDQFPDTIKSVIFQRNAFSPINDGRYFDIEVTQNTIDAVNAALNGLDTTEGSTFFMVPNHSEPKNVAWFNNKLEFVFVDSLGHNFYRLK